MGWKFWIDRGGTFTDLVGVSPLGLHIVRKVLSEQPDQLGDPIVRAIREILNVKENEPIPSGLIMEIRLGTTVATNALLENSGSPVVLFCNRGLRDLLRIGDQHRSELFSLKINRPRFLANAVIEVSGRINAQGQETEPLVIDKNLEIQARQHCINGKKSCAVAFINSYRNQRHELQLKEWLLRVGFTSVICSHEVSPLPRLVPRGQTTLIEASVAPVLFDNLIKVSEELDTSTRLRIMGSSGALLQSKKLLAKDTILSGPAGGMIGALAAARDSGLDQQPLIGFDMGGTSTDVCYISAAQGDDWERHPETEIAGQRLMARRLPIHTVAAGGGSIVFTKGGRLRVGPRSAGANPGPACYRRGGPLTITDANLLLGRLQAKTFPKVFGSSGDQTLDLSIVKRKFSQIGKTLGRSAEEIAEGALKIAIERMADAIKQVSIFCGYDIREGVLVAFGGAGGQHACRLANELGLNKVLIHPLAGVLSAYGIGIARQAQFRTKSICQPLRKDLLDNLLEVWKLEQEIAQKLLEENVDLQKDDRRLEVVGFARVEVRYKSNEQGILIALDPHMEVEKLSEKFETAHLKKFGYIPPRNQPLFIERLEVEVAEKTTEKNKLIYKNNDSYNPTPRFVEMHLPSGRWEKVPCYQRKNLSADCILEGPALIVESTNSIVLEPQWIATVDVNGSLILELTTCRRSLPSPSQKRSQLDPILLELFHHRFIGIAKKMGERLKNTSRSVNIRERLDFSCAIFDRRGALIANAPHIPVHLGSMGESIVDLLKQISSGERDPLVERETVLSNDPFHGGTHLPDITAITPIFAGQKEPHYFVACRGHHADVGGLTPGSMPPFSKVIDDEGLLLRNETFVVNGHHDRNRWEKRLHQGKMPPRNPSELFADLHAQVAANQLGVNEMEKLIGQVGNEEVSTYMEYLQTTASVAVQNLITTLENKSFAVELDNGGKLILNITVDKINQKAKLDFTGTSSQGKDNFQAPLAITKAAVLYVLRCLVEEDIPLNSGCFKPIELIVPKGCLLNPISPAAVVAGNVETSQALCNLLLGALGIMSASQGTMNNLTFGDEKYQYYETIAGGSGAGNGFNGTDGIQTHMTNSRLTDPEILEQRYPVQLELFSIRKGSGGLGRWIGGNGLLRKFRFLSPMTVSILSGSRLIPPFGLAGGMPGATGFDQLELIDGQKKLLKGSSSIQVTSGEALLIATPGGGGYGEVNGCIK